jgi:PAS domain S-box-containing protein
MRDSAEKEMPEGEEVLHLTDSSLFDQRLRPIFNLIPSFVMILNPEGNVIEVNKSALELADLSPEDIFSKKLWNCHWWSYSPDAQLRLHETVTRAGQGETSRFETLVQTKSGAFATFDCTIAPAYDASNRVDFITVSGIDISSRLAVEGHLRESEKRFRGTFENAAVGMAHVSLDGKWLRFNEVLLKILGYSQNEFQHKTLPELAHPEDLPGHLRQFGLLKSGKIDHYKREKRYVRKDGQFVWVDVTVSLQRSDVGEPLYAILVIEDITLRKVAEHRQHLLVAELSHRVKNIMSMVQAIANQSFGRDSDSNNYVTAFRARLQAMSRAHDLLTQESWQRAELSELIQSLTIIDNDADRERVTIKGAPVMLPGQLALNLSLVIHELASNALRHGALSVSEGRIDISWTVEDSTDLKIVNMNWRELNGPPAYPPTVLGFGARLVERSLRRGLGAQIDYEWEKSGLIVHIQLPVPQMHHEDYFAP